MGWVWLFAIGLAAFGLLWLGGVSRSLSLLSAAALLVGGAGYALATECGASRAVRPVRSSAGSTSTPAWSRSDRRSCRPTLPPPATLAAADDRMRAGDTAGAVQLLIDAVRRPARQCGLVDRTWQRLTFHDAGPTVPRRARCLPPRLRACARPAGPRLLPRPGPHPGGDLPAARRAWLQALALAPRDAPWRVLIAERLVMIDRFLAMQAGEGTGTATPDRRDHRSDRAIPSLQPVRLAEVGHFRRKRAAFTAHRMARGLERRMDPRADRRRASQRPARCFRH